MTVSVPSEINAQIARVTAVLDDALGDDLLAAYLFSSAVEGGLRPLSDVDLLVVMRRPVPDSTRARLMRELLTVSAAPGADPVLRAVEVTGLVVDTLRAWRYPPRRELQFGEWERDSISAGDYGEPQDDPDVVFLIMKARAHSIPLLGPDSTRLLPVISAADLTRAIADTVAQWKHRRDWEGDELTVVLALARLWFTAETGDIAPKHTAASWAIERLPAHSQPLLQRARAAYLSGDDADLAQDAEQVARLIETMKTRVMRALRPTSN